MAQLRRPFEEFAEEETPSATTQYDPYLSSESPPLRSVTRVVKTDRVVKENDGDGAKVTEQVVTQYTSTFVGGEEDDVDDDAERILQQETSCYYEAPAQEVPVAPPVQADPAAVFDYGNQPFYGRGAYYADQPPVPGYVPNQAYVAPFFGDQQAPGFYRRGDDASPPGRPAT
ncbi:hypothetical protein SUGI_0825130 [Cryptomeria japonica]|nr:hypothetical protein SUGI_0825130 [Cryptomeria japonica]